MLRYVGNVGTECHGGSPGRFRVAGVDALLDLGPLGLRLPGTVAGSPGLLPDSCALGAAPPRVPALLVIPSAQVECLNRECDCGLE
jgi:hypothetical protein